MNGKSLLSRLRIEELFRDFTDRFRSLFFSGVERLRIGDQTFHILLASAIGVASALATGAFLYMVRFAETFFFGRLFPAMGSRGFLVFLLPALGGLLIAPLIHFFPSEAEGTGIPHTMESVAIRGGVMRLRAVALRTIAAVLTIGSGGSAGRFAPSAVLGAAVGSGVGRFLRVSGERMRSLVGCGAAAAIAAVFNAPIGGVFFALEVILGDFSAQMFAPIVVSSVAATAVSRAFIGNLLFLDGVPHIVFAGAPQIGLCLVLGAACGAAAILFIRGLESAEGKFSSSGIPRWLRAAVGGGLTGLIAVEFPQVLGTDLATLGTAVSGNLPWLLAIWIAFLKMTATSLSLGSGGSGGIVGPSLFIGGMIGASAGGVLSSWLPAIAGSAGGYVLVGMAAFLAPVIGAPLTAILILFEITGDYSVILPLLAAVISSMLVAGRFSRFSLYTLKLHRRGIDLSGGRESGVLKNLPVREAMRPEAHTIASTATFAELSRRFLEDPVDYLYTTGESGELTGVVSFTDIRPYIKEEGLSSLVLVRDIATPNPVAVTPDETVHDALVKFGYRNVAQLPVVADPHSRKLIGVLRRKEILEVYRKRIVSGERY
ncbi:MAG: chloride channel protein [Deltaproteobacteria bacterium]|nr:chloride channel protein [Deltaproteobacteria bacterium]